MDMDAVSKDDTITNITIPINRISYDSHPIPDIGEISIDPPRNSINAIFLGENLVCADGRGGLQYDEELHSRIL